MTYLRDGGCGGTLALRVRVVFTEEKKKWVNVVGVVLFIPLASSGDLSLRFFPKVNTRQNLGSFI